MDKYAILQSLQNIFSKEMLIIFCFNKLNLVISKMFGRSIQYLELVFRNSNDLLSYSHYYEDLHCYSLKPEK